jgi:hypothetical protein
MGRLRFTSVQVVGCILCGLAYGFIYGAGPRRVWTDVVGDLLGGVLAAFMVVFLVKLIGCGWDAIFKRKKRSS